LQAQGLTAYEYQCGRGVNVGEATARALGEEAAARGIAVSLHAPYYISLASAEEEKRLGSLRYITDSARAVTWMGGCRIVVHPGGLNKRTREDATRVACDTLAAAQRELDEQGLSQVRICPETMGKINQLGDLEEVITMCGVDERFLPCVDFGHLNARTLGGLHEEGAFAAVLDRLADALGQERASQMHIHFSKIEYSAGGEKRHLTFEDTLYGPDPAPLMRELARRGWTPFVICESDGTQAEDARALRELFRA
jgi:deoxyribonuclease-4